MQPAVRPYMRDPSLPQLRSWQPCRESINSSAGGTACDPPSRGHLLEAAHRHHDASRTRRAARAGRYAAHRHGVRRLQVPRRFSPAPGAFVSPG